MTITDSQTSFGSLETTPLQVEAGFDTFIIAAVHFEDGKFGASVFTNGEVKVLNDDKHGIYRDLFDMLSLQETELKIISSTRSNIPALKQSLPQGAALQLVPSTDFSMCTTDEIENEFYIQLNQKSGKSNEASFKSLRALLLHLSKLIPSEKMPKNVDFLQIDSTNVSVSKSCLQALQIFDFEPHPNMHATNHGFKEGSSIFSLFNQAVSEDGRAKLKKWFQFPTNNIQILKSRQDSIETLIKSDMNSFIKSVTKSLKRSIRISNVINDLKFRPDASDLMKIEKFCEAFHEINSQAHDLTTSSFPLIETLRSIDFSPIFALSHLIRRIIDVEKYKTSEINTVRDHVSPDLDILRVKYRNLPEFLNSAVSEIAQEINSKELETVNIVYFPQLGFLITLPIPTKHGIYPTALLNQLNFELQFQSDKICYYKNDKMRQLDESIGDVYADIIDVQLEIMQQIVNEAVACENLLKEALQICSELDCLISLSKTAHMYSLNRPEIVADSEILQIEDGRHLLVELFSNRQCIANDCNLNGDQTKMVITGANSSGKSVYLKQVGIITFLAHIGSFVPARSARIGLIDRITTRIRTVESSGKGESCFMIDLKQVKAICETASQRSLILIDEFGKGTNQNDGMALFSGLLGFISGKQVRLIAITHMYEVFRHQLIPEAGKLFKFSHMKVIPDKIGLCYLYKLTDGLGEEESFAIECARESGIPEEVLNKAINIIHELKNGASPEDLKLLHENHQELAMAIQTINSIVNIP